MQRPRAVRRLHHPRPTALAAIRDVFAAGQRQRGRDVAPPSPTTHQRRRLSARSRTPPSASPSPTASSTRAPTPMVTLATAHPAKFPAAVKAATGIEPALPLWLADLNDRRGALRRARQRSGRGRGLHPGPHPRRGGVRVSVQSTTLDNGMTVLTDDMPHLESASLGIWVKAGSRSETKAEHGISHMLEHMAFKGTTTRNALQIAEAIENVGGDLNAATSVEHTGYFARVLKEDVVARRRYPLRHPPELAVRPARARPRAAGHRPGDRRRARQSRRSRLRSLPGGRLSRSADRPHHPRHRRLA